MPCCRSGEAGVDAGGVTKDFFCSFFTAVVNPRLGLFETKARARDVGCSISSPPPLTQNGKTFLPVAEPRFGRGRSGGGGGVTDELRQQHSAWELRLRKLEAVGRVLGKAVAVQVTVPDLFPPSFFKHLVGHVRRGVLGVMLGHDIPPTPPPTPTPSGPSSAFSHDGFRSRAGSKTWSRSTRRWHGSCGITCSPRT